ncbi:MAG: bifunctional 2-keto-4-hydroxyglutarate aldolase/2-keto-3-deoxy-6-phosphogluconate aldolase [Desulfacinum sp.]|jgi:2-dehydro-3-deoxyphosphogluconate aldolase/(4S)-4-hydroxy-2-oxoglutarate aldolase|nr:bifunctional 2-keto-4-hydroxyglutarate aldolase/2-keto-3-deoxy-6-phosphogluconate aldolase [Desulfacinum sp.]MBC7360145.1 bifunctional 2-keto-4-hydroxyglutarate aldolase/2-keto-3-deoxy-6-phosphogluconate aldolase [Desulfacinum sp.]MBZ4660291.1 2-dehydro-3-deoxyphosphogluconate aldolase/4-hydroxy-2-oxoglutarate aldolase [Desulfacinum sp.]
MLDKRICLERIEKTGIVAVVRAKSPDRALRIADAVKRGGVDVIEITMTVPGALEVIRELSRAYPGDEVLVGAGTVLDSETARACLMAGARFVVSPGTDLDTIRLCNRYRVAVMPGVFTPTELMHALQAGADVCKIFPASLFGPAVIRAMKGPFPQALLMPTGGVNADNVGEWIRAGSFAVGAGSELTSGAEDGNYDLVTETAQLFVRRIRQARAEMAGSSR